MMSLSFSAIAATAASPEKIDTLSTYTLQGVQVTSTRATKTTPMAFATLKKSQINNLNYGLDIPYILSLTPSVTTTSTRATASDTRRFACVALTRRA